MYSTLYQILYQDCSTTLKWYTSLHLHCYHLTKAIIRSYLNYQSNLLISCLASIFGRVQSVLQTTASDQVA